MHATLPDKTKDQHILIGKAAIKELLEASDLTTDDRVLDIGAGPGGLTEAIASRAGSVIAVENDHAYASVLRKRFSSSARVKVIEGNILEVTLPTFDRIVSNPPYGILQPFFLRLLRERKHEFKSCVIIVPYGFSKVATASPGSHNFGVMSAFFYAFYNVEKISEVGRAAFSPEPKVRSLILRISQKKDATPLSEMLRLMFLKDGKKVRNTIVDELWNHGDILVGRKLTQKESRMIILTIETQHEMKSILEKRILQLSNEQMAILSSSMLALLEQGRSNL